MLGAIDESRRQAGEAGNGAKVVRELGADGLRGRAQETPQGDMGRTCTSIRAQIGVPAADILHLMALDCRGGSHR